MRSSLARLIVGIGLVAVPLMAVPLTAQAETLLQNDSVDEQFDGTTASARLIADEMYEATFEIPEAWLPVEMLGVRVVMVKDPNFALGCGRFGIEVWEESTAASQTANCTIANISHKDPGAQIFTQDSVVDPQTGTVVGFEVRGDETRGNATFKDLRFSSINMLSGITLNPVMLDTSTVRVAIRALDLQCTAGGQIQSGDHFPVLISDTDGVAQPETNFLYGEPEVSGISLCTNVMGPQHYVWEDFGPVFQNSQPGDFVMRLILDHDEPGNGDPDMGSSDDTGMSSLDASFGDDMGMGGGDTGNGGSGDMSFADSANNANNGTGNNANNANNNTNGAGLMIDSVTPDSGTNDQSVAIVIVGSGFEAGAEVLLDAENIGVTETRTGRIRATVPEGLEPALYDLIVTNPDGETAILIDGYEVLAVAPESGADRAATSDGCCSEVHGARTTSSVAYGLFALLLALAFGLRRRAA